MNYIHRVYEVRTVFISSSYFFALLFLRFWPPVIRASRSIIYLSVMAQWAQDSGARIPTRTHV